MKLLGALLAMVTGSWPLSAVAVPFEGGSAALLGAAAWAIALWMLVSVLSAVLIAYWFRARALANERISADIRREDWAAALADPERAVE